MYDVIILYFLVLMAVSIFISLEIFEYLKKRRFEWWKKYCETNEETKRFDDYDKAIDVIDINKRRNHITLTEGLMKGNCKKHSDALKPIKRPPCGVPVINHLVTEEEPDVESDIELRCPACQSDMKEYVTQFKCRNCNYVYRKKFQWSAK